MPGSCSCLNVIEAVRPSGQTSLLEATITALPPAGDGGCWKGDWTTTRCRAPRSVGVPVVPKITTGRA